MGNLRWLTAGESHGPGLVGILEGMPAGVPLTAEDIRRDLSRRQQGYGRGRRQEIESDEAEILSGIRDGLTLGSPIALLIRNRDWENWREIMAVDQVADHGRRRLTRPRPGHADLSGGLKYGHQDLRNVLERSSARETAARVALGAAARRFLEELGIQVFAHVTAIGDAAADPERMAPWHPEAGRGRLPRLDVAALRRRIEASPVRTLDAGAEAAMLAAVDRARDDLESIGGVFEVVALGVPPGLGSHVHWDRRADARIAQAMMSIQAMKGVEIGAGFEAARRPGSRVHDEIFYDPDVGYYRETNRAGGIEGGMTNGEPVVVRVAMKPIPTLRRPLRSVDMETHEPVEAARERSDTCAVPRAAVVGEAMLCLVLADLVLEKFGGDSLAEVRRNLDAYRESLARR
ncbi:MAG: chorismate synthase [Thermaerobacter sp.]|nr:chorismate synthase [Bacillota bacterium]